MEVSVLLVRKPQGNPAIVVKAMPIAVTVVQSVAAGRILGSSRFGSLNRSRQLTGVQTVRATKASRNHNGATIAARNVVTTGRRMAGNAMMVNAAVFVAATL
jgi:hypothetical protein